MTKIWTNCVYLQLYMSVRSAEQGFLLKEAEKTIRKQAFSDLY